MSSAADPTEQTASADFTKTWRYKLGLFMIVVGNLGIVGAVKESCTAPVGRTLHRIGIVLLLTNVVTTYLMMLYAWDAFAIAVAEGPAAPVWGLNIEEQGSLVFYLFLIGEIAFLVSIYVLGANWWDKFRRIFVWEGTAS